MSNWPRRRPATPDRCCDKDLGNLTHHKWVSAPGVPRHQIENSSPIDTYGRVEKYYHWVAYPNWGRPLATLISPRREMTRATLERTDMSELSCGELTFTGGGAGGGKRGGGAGGGKS